MLERLNVVLYFLKLTCFFLSHYGFYCFYLQLLKRKSSVLDSDIGSVGPIRRIRHKPNLLSSKSSRTAIGGSPLSEKSLFSSILNKSSDAETSGTQVAPVSSMTVGLASSTFDTVVVPLKELNNAAPPPVFSFDSKDHVKKAPPFTFSSLPPPAVVESFGAFSEPKPESSSSRSVSTFQHLINCLGNICCLIIPFLLP